MSDFLDLQPFELIDAMQVYNKDLQDFNHFFLTQFRMINYYSIAPHSKRRTSPEKLYTFDFEREELKQKFKSNVIPLEDAELMKKAGIVLKTK